MENSARIPGALTPLTKHGESETILRGGERNRFVKRGAKAVHELDDLLHSSDEHVRWEAAKALGEIGGGEAMMSLSTALADESVDVRWVAAEGMVARGRQSIEPLLHQLINRAGLIWVRESARWIIGAQLHEEEISLLRPVLHALQSNAPVFEVPIVAYEALVTLHRQQADLDSTGLP